MVPDLYGRVLPENCFWKKYKVKYMSINEVIHYDDSELTDTAKRLVKELHIILVNNCNKGLKAYLESTYVGDWRLDTIFQKGSETCVRKVKTRLKRFCPFWQSAIGLGKNTIISFSDYMESRGLSLSVKMDQPQTFFMFDDVLNQHDGLEDNVRSLFISLMLSMKGNCNRSLLEYLMTPFEKWDIRMVKKFASKTSYKMFESRLHTIFKSRLNDIPHKDWPTDMASYILHYLYMKDIQAKPPFNGVKYKEQEKEIEDDFEVPDFDPEPEPEIALEKPARDKIEGDAKRIKEAYQAQRSQPKVEITPYNLKGVCETFVALPGGVVGGRYSEIMPGNGEIVKTIIINWADRKAAEVYIGQAIHRSKVEAFYNYELAKDFFDAKLMTSANEAMDMLSNFFRQCDSVDEIDLIRLRMNKMLENI